MMNLPIYRAKRLDGNDWIEGYLLPPTVLDHIKLMTSTPIGNGFFNQSCTVCPKTLSIHFPNMIDKNGKRFFASLSSNAEDKLLGGDYGRYKMPDVSQSKEHWVFGNVVFMDELNRIIFLTKDGDELPIDVNSVIEIFGMNEGSK